MDEVLVKFIQLLRAAGMRVSSSEALDAMRGTATVGLQDRGMLKAALRASLVKRSDDIATFDALFEHYFGGGEGQPGQGQGGPGQRNPLWQRQMNVDEAIRRALEEMARRGQTPGQLSRDVLRGDMNSVLDTMAMLGMLRERMERDLSQRGQQGQEGQEGQDGQQAQQGQQPGGQPRPGQGRPGQRGQRGQRGAGAMSPWQMLESMGWDQARREMNQMADALDRMGEKELARLLRERIREVEELFPRWVAAEAAEARQRQLQEQQDQPSQGGMGGEGPNVEGVPPTGPAMMKKDFSQYTPEEVKVMQSVVQQFAKKLSQDLSRRRQVGGRKRLDFSRTMRASLSTNGVPMELWYKQPRRNRLRIVVLCDVSSSVRNASRFMLQLLYSLQQQRGRVRSFVFISDLTEVSQFFQTHTIDEAVEMALSNADIRYWAHSDFGRAFRVFLDRYPDAITSRTTVLILGDGRSNFYDPQLEALATIHKQVKRVIWLNPESRWGWGSGDSIIDVYEQETDVLEECRNLEQLMEIMRMLQA